MSTLRRAASLSMLPFLVAACMGDVSDGDHHDYEEDDVGEVSSALSKSSPVSAAVGQSCSTTSVKGLATQLVEEIQCLEPGSMKRIDKTPGLSLGGAVFPFLQTPAANALVAAQKARGVTLSLNSGLRALPQQYLLYRWYKTGRCGIGLAARPGTSNHESGIAVDIQNNAAWRSAMKKQGFAWLGSSDPVHFDYKGGGVIDMKGLSVEAFQRLWNRNHPDDVIDEDGVYGPATEARLAKSPVGGFPKGATCNKPMSTPDDTEPPATEDASPAPDDVDVDDTVGDEDADEERTTTSAPLGAPRLGTAEQGCAVIPGARPDGAVAVLALGVACAALGRRRRRT